MSSNNPFAPPGAVVADVSQGASGYQPVRFWSPNGRIGRLRYLAYTMGLTILTALLGGVLGFIAGLSGSGATGGSLAGAVAGLFGLVASVVLLIQRSHDMDLSGWTCLLALIPIVGLYWLFKGGTPGPNRFGAPPPPNTLFIKIVGLFFPLIFVVGIVTAIALPAYQSYTMRAKAMHAP